MSEADPNKLEALILARLSVQSKQAPTRASVSRALHGMLARRFTKAEWEEAFGSALESLRSAGLIDGKRLSLTDEGRARLQASLGLKRPPVTKTWAELKARHLPRLLFAGVAAPEGTKIDSSVALLAQRLRVSFDPKSSTSSVINAWLARELGLPPSKRLDFGALRAALLARELDLPPRASLPEVARLAAASLSGATSGKSEAVTDALTLSWLFAGPPGRPEPRPDHEDALLARLVAKVSDVTRGQNVRQFGPNKVFIASVWQALAFDAEVAALGEAEFKRLLAEAHRRGLLALSRADLVAAMDADLVTASETKHQNATYHFILRGASA